jgi:hypothetical protein
MKRDLRIFAFQVLFVFAAGCLFTYLPARWFQQETVFVKTFDCPDGKSVPVVAADDTPVVQCWWHKQDRHLVYHQSGNLTYVDTDTFRQLAAAHEHGDDR